MQVIPQTDKQKMAMYMKLPKKKIIAMLIQCNKMIDYYSNNANPIVTNQTTAYKK